MRLLCDDKVTVNDGKNLPTMTSRILANRNVETGRSEWTCIMILVISSGGCAQTLEVLYFVFDWKCQNDDEVVCKVC